MVGPVLERLDVLTGKRFGLGAGGVKVVGVLVAQHPARLAGVGPGDDRVVFAHGQDLVLVTDHRSGFGGGDEASTDPYAVGTQGEGGGKVATVVDAPGGHHRHPVADRVHHLRYQGEGGDGTGVSAGLGSLGHHDVAPRFDRGDGVADLPAHVDHQHVALVAEIDHISGHAETGHEHRGPAIGHGIDVSDHVSGGGGQQVRSEGLGGGGPDLGDLFDHDVVAHGGRSQAAEPAGLGDGGDHLGVGDAAHAGEHHRVFDVEDLGESGAHGRGW